MANQETEAVLLELLRLAPLRPMLDPHISWTDGSTPKFCLQSYTDWLGYIYPRRQKRP